MPATQGYRQWLITDVYGDRAYREVAAPCAVDALARFAIAEGFADPREVAKDDPSMDFFYLTSDGNVGMIFTNTELTALAL